MSPTVSPKVLLFDLYGTLIDIETDERSFEVWERFARLLTDEGLPSAHPAALRHSYRRLLRANRRQRGEAHPEFEAVALFTALLAQVGGTATPARAAELARRFRALTMRRCRPFPDALSTLMALKGRVRLGLISDAQRLFLEPELSLAGLVPFFEVVVISSDHGFRKPDPRLFHHALEALGHRPEEAWYIGDNPKRDMVGARSAGLRGILIRREGGVFAGREPLGDAVIESLSELMAMIAPPPSINLEPV